MQFFYSFCRDFVKSNQVNNDLCNNQMDFYLPFAESLPCVEPLLPADSGLTYHLNQNNHPPRKRPRENTNNCNSIYDLEASLSQKSKLSSFSSFLDEDVAFQFQQQQQEIDRHLAHHVSQVLYIISLHFFVLKKPFFLFFLFFG